MDPRGMPGTWSDTYTVRAYEIGPDRVAGVQILGNLMQESAGHSADDLGFSMERLGREGKAWVLTRMRLLVNRLPAGGEQVTVVTWPSALEKAIAMRDFFLADGEGKPLASATTSWVCLDLSTRRMVPLPGFITDGYPSEHPGRIQEFETRVVPKLVHAAASARLVARRGDLDMNGHVNNVHYLAWLMEAIPSSWPRRLREVDIQYRAECLAGDEIESRCEWDEGEGGVVQMRHSVVRSSDDAELVRAITRWQK